MKFLKILANLLGVQAVAQKENQVSLTGEQETRLTSVLGEEHFKTLIEQANAELQGVATAKEELESIKASSEEDKATLLAKIEELETEKSQLKANVEKLSAEPETIVESGKNLAGAVFAENGQLFGLEGKIWSIDAPWNAKALSGAKGSTTNFKSSAAIQRMNDDFLDFVRTYPTEVESLFNKYFTLPAHWPTITGVATEVMSATISVANVTQPRKATWAPKGDVVFKAEVMRVYPTQIDLQFNYAELQRIETNWLNSFNKEGTQAYKMSFIAFLLMEFLKKARMEDADVLIRGVHVPTPEDRDKEKPVSHLNRANGLLKLIFDARTEKKYRPFNMGMSWTYANAVDYIDGFIKKLPDTVRSSEALQMILSPSKIMDYKRRYAELFGGNQDYTGYPETPRDYPNIKFVPLQWLEGSDVIIITPMDNIKILEFKPEEKSILTVEKFLRDVYVFGDYRLGIGIQHIGLPVVEGDPLALVKQAIWTNNTPLFSVNFFSTAYDNKTGILEVNHNRIKPDVDFSTDIKDIKGNIGDILIIRGDISMPTDVKVKNTAKISLANNKDFKLKEGGDLTLIKKADKWVEVSRTTAPALESSVIVFKDNILEYKAEEYSYAGTDDTLTKIEGGAEGNRLRITGGANTLTINSVQGNIKVDSAVQLQGEDKFIDFVFVNGVWTELDRG